MSTQSDDHLLPKSILDWQSFGLREAYATRNPVQYVVGNLFEVPSLSIVYGSPASFKSFLLADLACCVAGGKVWLPVSDDFHESGYPVQQRSVVWIDFDNGRRRTLDRFAALGRKIGVPVDAPLYIFSVPIPAYDARDEKRTRELIEKILEVEGKFVVFDNLSLISGRADENSSDMVSVIQNTRSIAEKTGASVTVIHHPRKANHPNETSASDLRGHSSIEALIDLALRMDRQGDTPITTISGTKFRDARIEEFNARFEFEQDQEGNLSLARFYSSPTQQEITTQRIRQAIWEVLKSSEMNKGTLTESVKGKVAGPGVEKIQREIEWMCDQGFTLVRKGDNNASIYSQNPEKPF